MALNQPPDPLHRATQAMRQSEEPGWIELSGAVMARVRSVVTPSAPILTHPPTDHDADHDADHGADVEQREPRTWISARVLRTLLRSRLRTATYAPAALEFDLDDDHLTRVRIDLVCSYGTNLPAAGEEARSRVQEVLADLHLVASDPGVAPIEITITDITEGDPTLV